jgi:DNA-binding transcriptional MerR regulator
MMTEQNTFSIEELATLTDIPRRTVRYYIQRTLVDQPEGSRRGAYYTRRHLEQLLEVRKWQRAGLSLERIKELMSEPAGDDLPVPPKRNLPGDVTVRSHITIRPGVELVIDPGEAGMTPEQVRDLIRKVIDLLVQEKETDQ